MMLMMSIVAGAGLMGIKNLRLPKNIILRLRLPPVMKNVGYVLCLALVAITLVVCLPVRHDIPYYHMIDDADYNDYVWIRDNIGDEYKKAILDPWKGTPFTAITGKNIYTRIHSFPLPMDIEAREFIEDGCTDTAFLRENEISIVHTRKSCDNPDLTPVRKDVYLLK